MCCSRLKLLCDEPLSLFTETLGAARHIHRFGVLEFRAAPTLMKVALE